MRKLFLIAFILILASCDIKPDLGIIVVPTNTNLPSAVPSRTTKGTQTSNQYNLLTTECAREQIEGTSGNLSHGRVIVEADNPHQTRFYDLKTKKQSPLDVHRDASNIAVSPDRKWIAYIRSQDEPGHEVLVVKSADAGNTYEYPLISEERQSISHWLDNKNIVLWNHSAPLDTIVIFNPFTKSKNEMPTNYPGILPTDDDWDSYWPSLTIYSPLLSNVLYVAKQGADYQPGYSKLILWDLGKNRQLAEIGNFGDSIAYPQWLSNGKKALFVKSVEGYDLPVAHDELYTVDLNGHASQITNLADYFAYARIFNYSLSPDGKTLAFIADTKQENSQNPETKLLLIDMANLQVKDLCVAPEKFSSLIWSPTSDGLAISSSTQDGGYQTLLLDIVRKEIIDRIASFRPVGWLN